MENRKFGEYEIELLNELTVINRKIKIASVLIFVIILSLPSVLVLNMFNILGGLITALIFIGLLVGLLMSVRMYNYNKIIGSTHMFILDGSLKHSLLKDKLNKKPSQL